MLKNGLISALISAITIYNCVAMDTPPLKSSSDKFKCFIGMSQELILPVLGNIGVVESRFKGKKPDNSIVYISPKLECKGLSPNLSSNAPLQIDMITIRVSNLEEIQSNDSDTSALMVDQGRTGVSQALKILRDRVSSDMISSHIYKEEFTADENNLPCLRVIDLLYDSDSTTSVSPYISRISGTISSGLEPSSSQELISTSSTADLSEKQQDKIKGYQKLLKENEELKLKKEQEFSEHADNVTATLRYVVPSAKIKLFSIEDDLSQLATDPDIDIVSISCFKYSEGNNAIDLTPFEAFNGSGKIVCIGLSNDHLPIALAHSIFSIPQQAQGYFPIFCSSSSFISDELIGDVGDYLPLNYSETPELQFLGQNYVTAPGVYLDFVDPTKDPLSGCSFSTPIVAGAALLLKSLYPTATNEQIKNALLEGGRKPSSERTPLVINDDAKAVFLQTVEILGLGLSLDWINNLSQEYARVFDLIKNHEIDLNLAKKITQNPVVFQHIWGQQDSNKFYNHLDIQRSCGLLDHLLK